MKKVPENIVLIIKEVAPLAIIVVLFFFLANIGYTKISQIQNEIKLAKKDQATLTEKLDLLRTVAVTGSSDSDSTINALPDNSPALLVMSQLRNSAAGSGLILSSIKAKADQNSGDLKAVEIDFRITGEKSLVEAFLLDIKNLAPISVLNRIKMAEVNGVYSGEVTVNSFWSALPTQLPATIEEFQDLTEDDKQTLTMVNSLKQPNFSSLPPAESSGKQNPFSK